MAVVHDTTLVPGKLELLSGWLPSRPWYRGTGSAPDLVRAGGFRVDDPAGEVGIQFLVVVDAGRTAYGTPLSYRGAPLAGADAALLGTSEHGVLGRRWVYDAVHDPVAVAQLLALLTGTARAQHQNLSVTPDDSVTTAWHRAGSLVPALPLEVTDRDATSVVAVVPREGGRLELHLPRVLDPAAREDDAAGWVTAPWDSPAHGLVTGRVAVVR